MQTGLPPRPASHSAPHSDAPEAYHRNRQRAISDHHTCSVSTQALASVALCASPNCTDPSLAALGAAVRCYAPAAAALIGGSSFALFGVPAGPPPPPAPPASGGAVVAEGVELVVVLVVGVVDVAVEAAVEVAAVDVDVAGKDRKDEPFPPVLSTFNLRHPLPPPRSRLADVRRHPIHTLCTLCFHPVYIQSTPCSHPVHPLLPVVYAVVWQMCGAGVSSATCRTQRDACDLEAPRGGGGEGAQHEHTQRELVGEEAPLRACLSVGEWQRDAPNHTTHTNAGAHDRLAKPRSRGRIRERQGHVPNHPLLPPRFR